MADLLNDPMVSAGAGLLVLCLLSACAFYIVSRFRDYAADDREDANELLANLREMHSKGDITDEEFRTIKLANQPHPTTDATNTDSQSSNEAESDD